MAMNWIKITTYTHFNNFHQCIDWTFIINIYTENDGVFLVFVLCHYDVFCSVLFYSILLHSIISQCIALEMASCWKKGWKEKMLSFYWLGSSPVQLSVSTQTMCQYCCWNCSLGFAQIKKVCRYQLWKIYLSGMTIFTRGSLFALSAKNMLYSFWEPNCWSQPRVWLKRIHSLLLSAVRNLFKVAMDDSRSSSGSRMSLPTVPRFWPGCP